MKELEQIIETLWKWPIDNFVLLTDEEQQKILDLKFADHLNASDAALAMPIGEYTAAIAYIAELLVKYSKVN